MENIIEKIKLAGVVGAGGAGFPTAVKLAGKAKYLIINGAECEPLLAVDQQLSLVYAAQLLETLNFLAEKLNIKKAYFALKEKYHEAIAALRSEIKKYPLLEIVTLANSYPMGDEHVLVYEVLKKIVPEGGIPLAQDTIVINVETLYNICLALDDQPVIEKFVTVGGAINNPATVKVKLGLSFQELIDYCGGPTVKNPVVIVGGPMMGPVESDFSLPITKTTKGLLVLNSDHYWVRSKSRNLAEMMRIGKTSCCHCMLCTDLCPRYLLGHHLYPDKLMRLASYNQTCEKDALATEVFLCCECALCEIACIMSLQPWKLNAELKKKLSLLGIKNPYNQEPKAVNMFREYRLYPVSKLIKRLGLADYEHQKAPLLDYKNKINKVVIPLKQHIGVPSVAVVKENQIVKSGQLVAENISGGLGVSYHASIDGRIKLSDTAIIIEGQGANNE